MKLDDLNEWKVFIVKAKQQKVCTCRFSSLGHKKVQKYLSSLPLSTSQKHSVLFQTFLTQNSLFILLKNLKNLLFSKWNFLCNLSYFWLILREDNTLIQSSSSCFVTSFERLPRLEKWRILHSEMRKGGNKILLFRLTFLHLRLWD